MADDTQFTFLRDGEPFHADRETEALFRAAQRWDHAHAERFGERSGLQMQDYVFEHGQAAGRIHEGLAHREQQNDLGGNIILTPAQARALAQNEHDQRGAFEQGGPVRVGMTADGVRKVFQMEPQEAIGRGLVKVDDIGGGQLTYRAKAQESQGYGQ